MVMQPIILAAKYIELVYVKINEWIARVNDVMIQPESFGKWFQ